MTDLASPSAATDSAPAGTYAIDPTHSTVGFVARHAMISKVRGSFGDVEGTGHFDAEDPTRSSLQLRIATASVTTGNDDRDGHLRNADFFDVESFPEITFTSTSVQRSGEDTYDVTGDLTVKDVTKPVTVAVELTGTAVDPFGNRRLGLEGTSKVNRKDWGLTWNAALEAGGVLVSETIALELEISAILQDG